jgi:hypothetical protein
MLAHRGGGKTLTVVENLGKGACQTRMPLNKCSLLFRRVAEQYR